MSTAAAAMADRQMAAPREFDPSNPLATPLGGEVAAPARSVFSIKPPSRALVVSNAAPRFPFQFKDGTGKMQEVSVVDKHARFTADRDELRSRWHSVAVRPKSGRVFVYDKAGALIARLDNWKQAEVVFQEAGILESVTGWLERQRLEREAAEREARDAAAQRVVVTSNGQPANNLESAIGSLAAILERMERAQGGTVATASPASAPASASGAVPARPSRRKQAEQSTAETETA